MTSINPERILFTTLMPYPEPADADIVAATNPTAARLLHTWRAIVPAQDDDGTGDFEDFFEMAARLDAVVRSGVASYAHLSGEDHVRILADRHDIESLDATHVSVFHTFLELDTAIHYGPTTTTSPLNIHLDSRADRYHQTAVFADHAGRATATGGYFDDTDEVPDHNHDHAHDQMAKFAAAGHSEVIVKHIRAKHGLWRVPTSVDPTVNLSALTTALGWSLIGLDGTPHGLGIQQIIDMTYEYRLFIINGRPVTGAGCIEEHTPLDADETTPFSPLMRARRPIYIPTSEADLEAHLDRTNIGPSTTLGTAAGAAVLNRLDHGFPTAPITVVDGSASDPCWHPPEPLVSTGEQVDPIESRPDLVAAYLAFAHTFAAQGAVQDSLPAVYVLDVAMSNGRPVVVEVNSLSNSGLYASQPIHVTRAMVADGLSQTRPDTARLLAPQSTLHG